MTEGVVRGNIDSPLIREDAGLNLPVGQAGTEGKRNVFVHGLKSLEDEGVAGRGGFDAVGEGGVNKIDKERRWKKGDVGVVGIVRGDTKGTSSKEGSSW